MLNILNINSLHFRIFKVFLLLSFSYFININLLLSYIENIAHVVDSDGSITQKIENKNYHHTLIFLDTALYFLH